MPLRSAVNSLAEISPEDQFGAGEPQRQLAMLKKYA
jgi:hypothetical protein